MKILCSLWLPGVTHGHHKILRCLPWDALSGFYLQPLLVFACFCIQLCLQWIKCILSWGQLRTWPFENILLGCSLNDVLGHYLSALWSSVSLHFAAFDFIHCFHIIASFCRAGQVFPVQIWPFTLSALMYKSSLETEKKQILTFLNSFFFFFFITKKRILQLSTLLCLVVF